MPGTFGTFSRKEILFARALEETRRGRELLVGRDIEGFQASISARQAIFDEIDRLGATDASGGNPDEVLALIGSIMELDRDTARLAADISRELEQGLKEVGSGKRLLAYGGAVSSSGTFVNKKG